MILFSAFWKTSKHQVTLGSGQNSQLAHGVPVTGLETTTSSAPFRTMLLRALWEVCVSSGHYDLGEIWKVGSTWRSCSLTQVPDILLGYNQLWWKSFRIMKNMPKFGCGLLKNNNTQDRLAQSQDFPQPWSKPTLSQSSHYTIHPSPYQIFTNTLGKYCHPLLGKLRLGKLKWVTKAIVLGKWWLRNFPIHQPCPFTPRKYRDENLQSCRGKQICQHTVMICALGHIKIGEIRGLRSQGFGLLSHEIWALIPIQASTSHVTLGKLCDLSHAHFPHLKEEVE